MRLTGGDGKGRKLVVPHESVRPTSSRIREVLFQILYDRVFEADVLDLYAGSGILGIEALARGARSAVFVEKNRKTAGTIKKNLDLCSFSGKSRVIVSPVDKFLKNRLDNRTFNLIFADPPYAIADLNGFFEQIEQSGLLAPGGLVMYEFSGRDKTTLVHPWIVRKDRVFGDTRIVLAKLEK